jgi:hypothetical protein
MCGRLRKKVSWMYNANVQCLRGLFPYWCLLNFSCWPWPLCVPIMVPECHFRYPAGSNFSRPSLSISTYDRPSCTVYHGGAYGHCSRSSTEFVRRPHSSSGVMVSGVRNGGRRSEWREYWGGVVDGVQWFRTRDFNIGSLWLSPLCELDLFRWRTEILGEASINDMV